jgi:hypothetical protein
MRPQQLADPARVVATEHAKPPLELVQHHPNMHVGVGVDPKVT